MKNASSFLFFTLTLVFIGCNKEPSSIIPDYRESFVGAYSGAYEYHITYPMQVDTTYTLYHGIKYAHGTMYVEQGQYCDSCVKIELELDSSSGWSRMYDIDANGKIFTQSGGGSGYKSLTIEVFPDSLFMLNFAKCGIPCDSWSILKAFKE